MREGRLRSIEMVFIVLCVLLVTILFLPAPGTDDVVSWWSNWARNADAHGLVAGFAANNADYPPLTTIILLAAAKCADLTGVTLFIAIKLSLVLFTCLTSFVFWLWTRDTALALFLHVSVLLSAVGLGYTDIYFAPTLVLSLWALKERRLTLFAVCFAIACWTKWQPIIILPFLGVYVLSVANVSDWRRVQAGRLAFGVVAPMAALSICLLAVFGIDPVWKAFTAALKHKFLSGNALNFNWVVTHALHVLRPDRFGGLVDGRAGFIETRASKYTDIPRTIFWLTYLGAWVSFIRREKTFLNTILFALTGYLVYFTFNTGVHENHLFVAMILALVLVSVDRAYLTAATVIVFMGNINLLLFYGVDGIWLRFSRVIGGVVDTALLFACLNVVFVAVFWTANVFGRRDRAGGTVAVAATDQRGAFDPPRR